MKPAQRQTLAASTLSSINSSPGQLRRLSFSNAQLAPKLLRGASRQLILLITHPIPTRSSASHLVAMWMSSRTFWGPG
eukprot:1141063-Pelagomonas_calceolata.AAC.7